MPYRKIVLSLLLLLLLLPCANAMAKVDWELIHTIKIEGTPRDTAGSTDGQWLYVLTDGGKVYVYNADGTVNDVIKVDPAMDRISVAGLQAGGIDDKIYVSSSRTGTTQVLAISFSATIDTSGAPFIGPANAPVEIVVFSDFECPYCSQVGALLDPVLERNPKNAKVVFKHYPLSFHKNARFAALAAMAAQKQGKFWEFHDRLFENHKNLSPERIRALAQEMKLDLAQFDRDLASRDLAQRLEKDINDAHRAGVRGTPTIFINGRRLKDRNAALIQQMIDEETRAGK